MAWEAPPRQVPRPLDCTLTDRLNEDGGFDRCSQTSLQGVSLQRGRTPLGMHCCPGSRGVPSTFLCIVYTERECGEFLTSYQKVSGLRSLDLKDKFERISLPPALGVRSVHFPVSLFPRIFGLNSPRGRNAHRVNGSPKFVSSPRSSRRAARPRPHRPLLSSSALGALPTLSAIRSAAR